MAFAGDTDISLNGHERVSARDRQTQVHVYRSMFTDRRQQTRSTF
jgi:hypothetical protein